MDQLSKLEDNDYVKMCDFYNPRDESRPIKYPINWEEILRECDNGVLKDAKIFKYLMGIDKPKYCKNFSPKYNFNYYIITFTQWSLFLKFIRFGKCDDYQLDELRHLCDKLGGIPHFDRYYKNLNKIKSITNNEYNPMFPKDDIKNLYEWRISESGGFLQDFYKNGLSSDFNVAGVKKYGNASHHIYFRKLKTNINRIYDDMHDFREDTAIA